MYLEAIHTVIIKWDLFFDLEIWLNGASKKKKGL